MQTFPPREKGSKMILAPLPMLDSSSSTQKVSTQSSLRQSESSFKTSSPKDLTGSFMTISTKLEEEDTN